MTPELQELVKRFKAKGLAGSAQEIRNYLSGHYSGSPDPSLKEEEVQAWLDGSELPDKEARQVIARAVVEFKKQGGAR